MSADEPSESEHAFSEDYASNETGEAVEPLPPLRAPWGSSNTGTPAPLLAPQIARLENELTMVRKSLRAQRAETRVEKQNSALLRAQLEQLQGAQGSEGLAPPQFSAEVQRLEAQHAEEIERLRREYEARAIDIEARCAREIAALEEKQAAKVNALRNSLRTAEELTLAKTERIKRLEARLERLQDADAVPLRRVKMPSGADDLTALPGVGPAYARALHREGVHSFSQIANWSFEDIERMAPKIGTTSGRIRRDDWVREARKIAQR